MPEVVEYSHVEISAVGSINGIEWSAIAYRMFESNVELTMTRWFDEVLFTSDDDDAEQYANWTNDFEVCGDLWLGTTKELAEHLNSLEKSFGVIRQRLELRRLG